ncbi:MAG: DUF5320 domain-containing protein [Candidatus Syntrophosphaera sp.]
MPNRDGTGPAGDGRPGRGLGNCGKNRTDLSRADRSNNGGIVEHGALLLLDIIKSLMNKKSNKDRR